MRRIVLLIAGLTSLIAFAAPAQAQVTVTPLEVQFGAQEVGTLSAPKSVQAIRAYGRGIKATVTGPDASDFVADRIDCRGETDYVREACGAVSLRFRPSAKGPRVASLVLEGAEPLSGAFRVVPLSGTGTESPRVVAPVTASWRVARTSTRLRRLLVSRVPKGARVQVRCSGKGCPFKRRAARVRDARADARKGLAKARLRRGATLEVRVVKLRAVGQVVRYRIRAGKLPSRRRLCLSPGRTTPRAC